MARPIGIPVFAAAVAVRHEIAPAPLSTRRLRIQMRGHESLQAALGRAGLDASQSLAAATALSNDFDTVNPHPGLPLELDVAEPSRSAAAPQLLALSLWPTQDIRLSLWRRAGDAFEVRRAEAPVFTAPAAIDGVVEGSFYLSLVGAGVDANTAFRVAGAFGRKLDLSRDIESGDRFRLVFEQRRDADGRVLGWGDPIYAQLTTRSGEARLYGVAGAAGSPVELVDGQNPGRPALLRTPVVDARITSGFGPRMHPILGFTRMHQGVDFAAPLGSPVLAAADGVVEEARWSGGYGRWLKIRHAAGLETGYAHLSAWAPGVGPGGAVRQGQVVGFVGATGMATGPHLHFEVFQQNRRVDPKLLYSSIAQTPGPTDRDAFRAMRARIDAIVEAIGAARAVA